MTAYASPRVKPMMSYDGIRAEVLIYFFFIFINNVGPGLFSTYIAFNCKCFLNIDINEFQGIDNLSLKTLFYFRKHRLHAERFILMPVN